MKQRVLELFAGLGLFGMGFQKAGFYVERGCDLIWGRDIRQFHPLGDAVGIIGGSPCQEFSGKNRNPDVDAGMEMLHEFERCVLEGNPEWFLLENVPSVPDLHIAGYTWQRIDLHATMFGLNQNRLRHFQFGSRTNRVLVLDRPKAKHRSKCQKTVLATEGEKSYRRSWEEFCRLQGLPADFQLAEGNKDPFTLAGKYRLVGNGVPVPMAHALAVAIKYAPEIGAVSVCECTCGRPTATARFASASCRKRAQRRRKRESADSVTPRRVTATEQTRHTVTVTTLQA